MSNYQLTTAKLVWSEEFDQPSLNMDDWSHVIGGSGFGNGEWEFYTDRPENIRIEKNKLVIEIRKEQFEHRDYTSARIHTKGKKEFTYGRFEARIKVPVSKGIWPAFWMNGNTNNQHWPACGEIDILEKIGREPKTVHGTLHGPGYAGAYGIGEPYTIDEDFGDDFHTFAIEWIPDQIQWFVDGNLFYTFQDTDLPEGVPYPFDHPFYILLNTAVGGSWPDYPDESTQLPQFMLVDWVRVYQCEEYPPKATNSGSSANLNMMLVEKVWTELDHDGDYWNAKGYVKINDASNRPLAGVTIRANFTRLVTEGISEMKQTTDTNGIAGPFISQATKEHGVIHFAVKNIEKTGFKVDIFNSSANTADAFRE